MFWRSPKSQLIVHGSSSPSLLPYYFMERKKQCKSIGNLCPRWDTYIADDVEDPKFITLYPKGYIHTYIHTYIHSFIHQNSIPFVIANNSIFTKRTSYFILFIHDPKKTQYQFAITPFFFI
jgi:hypothetical protein